MSQRQRLEIEVGLSRDAAVDSAKRLRAELKQLNEGVVNDSRVVIQQETELHKQARDARGRLIKQGADAAEAAGKSSFAAIATAAGGTLAVVKEVAAQIAQMASALDRVGQKSREMTREFASQRDKTRELAAVEGRTPDNKFTLGLHRFAKESALSYDEALNFRATFANVGNQFVGKNISQDEYAQYQALSAKQASRTGASTDAAASFAGAFLTRNLNQFGGKAAEEAFRRQFQIASIYDAGVGTATQNFTAFSQLKSAFEADPELQGAFKSDEELAVIGSVANAAGPDRQRDQVNDLVRNLRRPDNKALNALKKRAGVTNAMGVRQTIETLAPILVDEAKRTGQGLDQVIASYIPDVGAREALSIQIGRGVLGGEYAQRQGVAEASGAAGAGEQALGEFMGSEVARSRSASAGVAEAEAEQGAKNSGLDVLRKQALQRLIKTGRINSDSAAIRDFIVGKATFGVLGDLEQRNIDSEASRIIGARGGFDAGLGTAITPLQREEALRAKMTEATARGVDILAPNVAAESGIDDSISVDVADTAVKSAKKTAIGAAGPLAQMITILGSIANNTAPAKTPPRPLVQAPPMPRR